MQNRLFHLVFGFLAFLIFATSAYNTFVVSRQTSDENLYMNQKRGVIITQITPGGVSDDAGLRVGDRLVKINGEEISSASHAQSFLDRAKPGDSLTYTIERDGRIFDVNVQLALAGVRLWQVALFLTGFLFLLYGIFLAVSQPGNGKARLLAFGSLMFAFFMMNVHVAASLQHIWFYRIFIILVIMDGFQLFAVFLHASLYFPAQKFETIYRFRMIYLHYLVATAFMIYAIIRFLNGTMIFLLPIIIISLYAIVNELVYFHKRQKQYKARTRVFLGALLVMLALGLLGILTQYFFPEFRISETLSFGMILLPISYFYATIKYRVFDISVRVRLSIVYATLQISLLFLFVIAILVMIRVLSGWSIDLPGFFITGTSIEMRDTASLPPDIQIQVQRGYLILIGIALTAVLFYFKQWLQTFFEKIFFQQKYDYRRALKNFVEIISASFRRDEISQRSVDQITTIMRIKGAMILLGENGHFRIANASGSLADFQNRVVEIPENSLSFFSKKKTGIKQGDLNQIPPLSDFGEAVHHGISILSGGRILEAVLFTGEKLAESPYNTEDLELLDVFADHLGSAFERARLYEEMADKERIKKEIEIAREIQRKSLPGCEPEYPGLEICASLSPAAEVGGDYYDYIPFGREKLGIIIGDVVGKGTSAAFHMSKIQGFVRTLALEARPPEKLLARLNALIKDNFDPDFFCTAIFAVFDTRRKRLKLFRLGHSGMIYYNARRRSTDLLEPSGLGLGIGDNKKFIDNLEAAEIPYQKDDLFVFLTDGFTEAMNPGMKPYGEEKLCQLIQQHHSLSSSKLMEKLVDEVRAYSDGKWFDDATGIIVKIKDRLKK
jgi:serine phosphatase RsbU (regulator of sigma subunit)